MAGRAAPEYTGRLVVRFAQPVVDRIAQRAQNPALPDWSSVPELAHGLDLQGLQDRLQRYPAIPSYPLVRGRRVRTLLEQEARARNGQYPPQLSLTGYFILDPRGRISDTRAIRLLQDLNQAPEIAQVYRERGARSPTPPPTPWAVDPSDQFVPDQGYLDAAPRGIGANTADVWGFFDGGGVGFADVEAGWNLKHVEVPQPTVQTQPLINLNDPLEEEHGTGVLGIVLGQVGGGGQARGGITGIAPKAKFVGVASWVVHLTQPDVDIASAIYAAMGELQAGDVLLIEVETATGYPIEIEDPVFIAIQTAVSGAGLIVIEAAGNGTAGAGRDLDDPLPPQDGVRPTRSLNRALASFEDSGAIMVSSCRSNMTSTGAHRRVARAGFGSRIDCYAWGKNVATAGGTGLGPPAGPNRSYTDAFDGTSAAAAIVAGAALLVQDMSLAGSNGRTRLTPSDMRALFAGRIPGTDILAPSGNQKIGFMPNLQAIAASFART